MANGIIYDTMETEAVREYKKGYKEGFRDGYAASQQQMLSLKFPIPIVDQNNVVLYWQDGSSTKACICGGTGECKCKKNNSPTFLAG